MYKFKDKIATYGSPHLGQFFKLNGKAGIRHALSFIFVFFTISTVFLLSILIISNHLTNMAFFIKLIVFLYITYNIWDVSLNFKENREYYKTVCVEEKIWTFCLKHNKPYRLKELILDLPNLVNDSIWIIINPIRWLNLIIISTAYSVWRIVKSIITITIFIALVSVITTCWVTGLSISIGLLEVVNEITTFRLLIYVIFIERSFFDAFVLLYCLKISQKNKSLKFSKMNYLEKILFTRCTGYSIFRINTVFLIENKVWAAEYKVIREKNIKIWARQILKNLLKILQNILLTEYSSHILTSSGALIHVDKKIWINGREQIKKIMYNLKDFIERFDSKNIPTIEESKINVGYQEHRSVGIIPLKPEGFGLQNVLTFRSKIKIENKFLETKRNYEEGMPVHPLNFEFKEGVGQYVKYGSHQFTVPCLIRGKDIEKTNEVTVEKLLQKEAVQWKFLIKSAIESEVNKIMEKTDTKVLIQFKDPNESKLIEFNEVNTDRNQKIIDEMISEIGIQVIKPSLTLKEKIHENIPNKILGKHGSSEDTNILEKNIEEELKYGEDIKDEKRTLSEEDLNNVKDLKNLHILLDKIELKEFYDIIFRNEIGTIDSIEALTKGFPEN